jgi:hypothetical protein
MTEHRLFDGDVPHVSTAEFHAGRERAPHLEQAVHRPRLEMAASLVRQALDLIPSNWPHSRDPEASPWPGVSDLGCGDGGLLSLLPGSPTATCWGYDFQPSNKAGWAERQVLAKQRDVFGADRDKVHLGTISVCTEVLEHLADPHEVVRWIGSRSRFLVASSPWNETPESHDECHAWAWDHDGYRALIEQGGYRVLAHETVGQFQLILGEHP